MWEHETQLRFKSSCCRIKSLGILFPHITTIHSAVNEYPGTDGWICEWIFFAQYLQLGWMLPKEVEMALEWTCLPEGEVLSSLNSPKDWIPCCIRTFLYLRSSYRCCGSLEQFWWTESEQHQRSLQLDRCCLSPLCVFVITRHNCLASKPVMVLLQIHWIHDWNRHCKTCNDEWWWGENVTLDWKTNFYRCSNKSVLVLNGNGFCFGNLLYYYFFYLSFVKFPCASFLSSFLFHKHAVVKKSTSFIWVQPCGKKCILLKRRYIWFGDSMIFLSRIAKFVCVWSMSLKQFYVTCVFVWDSMKDSACWHLWWTSPCLTGWWPPLSTPPSSCGASWSAMMATSSCVR